MTDRFDTPFAANDVRLSPREWIIALVIAAAVLAMLPVAWGRLEPVEIQANHRMPFSLGSDYWTYNRMCRAVCAESDMMPVIGDSVVWGHYVGKDETLSAHLNSILGADPATARSAVTRRFANLGVDGIHPAALAGLMAHYGGAVSDRKVILHCNLLWMSSEESDLQSTKELPINHPDLIPQFRPDVPCYKASISHRLGVVIGRRLPLFGWSRHVQIAYLDSSDLATWTIDNPYGNPFDALAQELPSPDESPSPKPDARPWTAKRDVGKFDPPWVELADSFQWERFKRILEILVGRGNRVFVVVGPFNEHMLERESLATYTRRKAQVQAWLQEQGIGHCIPPVLPSDVYADSSHPLANGYALLAEELLTNEAFAGFVGYKGARR